MTKKTLYVISLFIHSIVFTQFILCMDDYTKSKLVKIFQKSYPSLQQFLKNELALKNPGYEHFYSNDYKPETTSSNNDDGDLNTAYDIMDSLPDSQYYYLTQSELRHSLAGEIKNALNIIKKQKPELKDYKNKNSDYHRCCFISFKDLNKEKLQQIIGFAKIYEAIPYYINVDFASNEPFISEWYIPKNTRREAFCQEIKNKFSQIIVARPHYFSYPAAGKYISLDCKNENWKFSFDDGTIVSVLWPDYYQKLRIKSTIVEYNRNTKNIESITQSIQERE